MELTDPQAVPANTLNGFGKALEKLVYDPRDVAFLKVTLKVSAVMLPLMIAIFVRFHWALVAVWAAAWAWFAPTVILMLHNTMHRPFFKRAGWATRAHSYWFTVLFGIPTGYMEHHVGMHHVENNLKGDLSATLRFERDNIFHFFLYFGRFFLFGMYEVPKYLINHKRSRLAWRAVVSELCHLTLMVSLYQVAPTATVITLVLPYCLVRFLMMWGNWGQHAFIDPKDPGNDLLNSITCINAGYNHRAFNDGYHIGHHVKANRHWTEMPKDFHDNLEQYGKADAVVFKSIDFFIVSLLLFTRQYGILAKLMVRLPGRERTHEEAIAFLKSRTRPIPLEVEEAAALSQQVA